MEKMTDQHDIFVSVVATATTTQEDFVRAVEDRLRSEGLLPHTVGRNTFSSDAPLKAVTQLLSTCAGTVVIALERSYYPTGISKRGGPKEAKLEEVRLPTAWNQVEAAMAYATDHPLLVIVEAGITSEGLLERGYDWYVQSVALDRTALTSLEFNGVLASWKAKVVERKGQTAAAAVVLTPSKAPQDMTVGELAGSLKPAHLWSSLVAIGGLVAGAYIAGSKIH